MRLAAGERLCIKYSGKAGDSENGHYFYVQVHDLYNYRNAYIYYGTALTHQAMTPKSGKVVTIPSRASTGIILLGEVDELVESATAVFLGLPWYMVEDPTAHQGKPIFNAKRSVVGGPVGPERDASVSRARILVNLYWELKENRGVLTAGMKRAIQHDEAGGV